VEYGQTLWAARDAGRQALRLGSSGITADGKNALTNRKIGVKIYSARDRFFAREKAMRAHDLR
jgi:hypothetical protein